MSPPTITGVHLCGSLPPEFKSTSEAFTTLSSALPNRLKRIPDGETGERYYFVSWQGRIIKQHPIVLSEYIRGPSKIEPATPPPLTDEERRKVIEAVGEVDVEYDKYAIESYKEFVRLRDEGVVEKGVKFLVCLPSPLTVVSVFIRDDLRAAYEEVYERGMLRALKNIEADIPAEDLSIQWDCPMEFALLEKADFPGPRATMTNIQKWWDDCSEMEGIVRRCTRLLENVSEEVEAGFHFCYGNSRNKHFVEPTDMGLMLDVADDVLSRVKRKVHFMHFPVPIARTDEAYFEPLKRVKKSLEGVDVVLGLVHANDLDGTRKRIETAGTVLEKFGVSSECGLGRAPSDAAMSVLEVAKAVCPAAVA